MNALRRTLPAASLSVALALGCSPKRYVINQASDALSESGSGTAWSGDEDPELVRDAMPFALKTMESLLEANPDHVGLHLALASGFTKYGYAFVQQEADRAADESYAAAQRGWDRARKLYRRAHRYALAGLDKVHPGFSQRLHSDPQAAAAMLTLADVEMAYWCGASLAAEITLSKTRPEVVAELPSVGAIMDRLLELDEDFDAGAVHSFMVSYESRGETMGGSYERARTHLERTVELTHGNKASPWVSWAEQYCVQKQDMACFTEHLAKALAVDVDKVAMWRLENVVAQRRATWLQSRAADLIDTWEEPQADPAADQPDPPPAEVDQTSPQTQESAP